jgi:TM2 domain-containing membrane protein YozV
LVKDELMVNNVVCGRCGSLIRQGEARCLSCGATSHAMLQRPRKSPWLAAGLAALIPGMGHIYLGQYPKGLVYLVGASGLTFLGLDLDLTVIGAAVGVPMELGALGLWAHGVWNAYQTARQMELQGL